MGLDKLIHNTANSLSAGYWRLPASLLLVALLLMFAGESGREGLRFDRAGIAAGQVWRLVTGHFVHLGWPHFALNAAGLVLVWFLVGQNFRNAQWYLIAAICIMTMDAGLWLLEPQLSWYV
ncbi:MAG: rhomboid family intramembrane serine protease, partial [Woeseiaceae bacterium]